MPLNSPKHSYAAAVRIANAAGRDEANRSAARAGRKSWNDDDLQAARETCDAVLIRLGFGHLIEDV